MSYRYLRTAQEVPGQGISFTYYEIEGEDSIVRMLTALPAVEKVSVYDRPPVKKLFAPERCEEATEQEFADLWQKGLDLKGD